MDNILYNLNVERAILSSIIFEPDIYEDLASKLNSNDFFDRFHQNLYIALGELFTAGKPISDDFIDIQMKKNNTYNVNAMLGVISSNPVSNYEAYTEEIKNKSLKRNLKTIALSSLNQIKDNVPTGEIITFMSNSIDDTDKHTLDEEQSTDKIMDEYLLDLKEVSKGDTVPWVKTGIESLDNLIDGFSPGDLVVVGARPSMGKTSLATTFTSNFLDAGYGVLFATLEMSTKKILNRILSTKSGEKLSDLKRGLVANPHTFNQAVAHIRKSNLVFFGEKNITFNALKLKIRRELRKNPSLRFLMLDHVGKLKFNDPRFLRIEIGQVTNELKAIAEEFGISVVLLTQLNRDVTNRKNNRPMLSDISESGNIEQDADIIIMPHRDSYYKRDNNEKEPPTTEALLIVPKNRDGVTGIAKTTFQGEMARFVTEGTVEIEYEGTLEMPTFN